MKLKHKKPFLLKCFFIEQESLIIDFEGRGIMKEFKLIDAKVAGFVIEDTAFEGVRRIAQKVIGDIETVCGQKADLSSLPVGETIILAGTWGKSPLLEQLVARDNLSLEALEGKREVYTIQIVESPFEHTESALVIAGSDKRGTIYGLFHLSELIGVTPYTYWGDVVAKTYKRIILREGATREEVQTAAFNETLLIGEDISYTSKEPSVKYRGFFINDEWPCFGNWTFSHFGGFTAEMYDKIFEFLLRLKGNYLWPAMWTSSFALDGPGLANAELADLYGVVIGNSHHEPCLRASEEWDIYKGKDAPYGTEWNYAINREGLLNYWADGLKRSGKYESLITIGMRGERDSSMLGEDSTLKENIDLLKDIIVEQRKLIRKYVDSDLSKVPQLLALYKEVEGYFYGDEKTPGLKDWEELEGVTFMLCEDNFGNMRTLPPAEKRNREGGWGMYYHFDYHGGPISYEWVNSTPLTKVWEQMSMAYEYGVKEVWIVNVGDLKFNEFPLGYFMTLAYDFERWGTQAPNTTGLYTEEWMRRQFGKFVSKEMIKELCEVVQEYTSLNSLRRPEALNAEIYHPAHFNEAERMLYRAERLHQKADKLLESMPSDCKAAYESMIYYPAAASANLLEMHLAAGINQLYAKQGRPVANEWAKRIEACIQKDRRLAKTFADQFEGKWRGMEKAHHIGFTNWNDQDYRYPIRCIVEPADEPRLVVLKKGETQTYTSSYFASMLEVDDFLSFGCEKVILEIINGGKGSLDWHIDTECEWLNLSKVSGSVTEEEQIQISILEDKMLKEKDEVLFTIQAGQEKVFVKVAACKRGTQRIPQGTFMPKDGVVTIEAEHYTKKVDQKAGRYIRLEGYGRYLSGMKPFPVTMTFTEENAPSLTYSFWVEENASYILEVQTSPSNPVVNQGALCFGLQVGDGENQVVNTIPEGYRSGDPYEMQWAQGVLDNIHKTCVEVKLEKGLNTLTLRAVDAPLVLERLLIYQIKDTPKASYLGPEESWQI